MNSYEEGQKLFELGMIYASKFKCSEAIKYYTLSIEANENPAPYINRANLLGKKFDISKHYKISYAQKISTKSKTMSFLMKLTEKSP